jgi:hypothetical protein
MASFRGACGKRLGFIHGSKAGAWWTAIISKVESCLGYGFRGAPPAAALNVIGISLLIGRRACLGLN